MRNEFDEYFPYQKNGIPQYREGQVECIAKAIQALEEQNYDLFIVDAPVGFGKSAVLMTVAQYFAMNKGKTFYVTPQKILQDQLLKDFPTIPQVKGRNNYICLERPVLNCEEGPCQIDKDYHCNFDPCMVGEDENRHPYKDTSECPQWCLYIENREECLKSDICVMNFAYFILAKIFGNRYLCIFDEAHSILEDIINFLGNTIRESDIGPFLPKSAGFDAHIALYKEGGRAFNNLVAKLREAEQEQRRQRMDDTRVGRLRSEVIRLEGVLDRLKIMVEDYERTKEPWVISYFGSRNYGQFIKYRPITSTRFLSRKVWNRGRKVILSSGTIIPSFYQKEGGLDSRQFDMKDCVYTAPTIFSPQKSPIYYKPVGKLTFGSDYDMNLAKIMNEINLIVRERQDRRGIIHTFSYPRAQYINDHIASDLRYLLVMQDKEDRPGSLKNWLEDEQKASLFVSTNMTEGLDLKDDLCRYQIYMKIGYMDLKDERVNIRLKKRHEQVWYSHEAIMDLEQASGRATRSKDDWSEMFVFDSSLSNLLNRYGNYFKQWFKDRLVMLNLNDIIPKMEK